MFVAIAVDKLTSSANLEKKDVAAKYPLFIKYHIITETNKFNKEKNKAILYKIVSSFQRSLAFKGIIGNNFVTLLLLVNKIIITPISGIKIK